MKVTRISRLALAAMTGALALAGCGDDGGNNTPDAPHGSDAGGSDGSGSDAGGGCTATSLASDTGYDVQRTDFEGLTVWNTTVTTDLGAGAATETFSLELFAGSLDFTSGPIDLSMGDQNNYATCLACVLIRETDAQGNPGRIFFQTGGTLTFSSDPVTGSLAGTATDLALEEVTIADDGSYTSTAVPGGACLTLGNLTLTAAMTHPYGWTCDDSKYSDTATCDCECGLIDPDCDDSSLPVGGCTGTQACISGACADTCDVLNDTGCTNAVCTIYSDDFDICRPTTDTSLDTAAIGDACNGSTLFCGVANTIAEGVCDVYQHDDETCTQVCGSADDCGPNEVCEPILTTKGLCTTIAANDTCASATALTLGTPVTGTTAGAANDYNAGLEGAACTGFMQPGQDVVYSIALTAGQNITVALSNSSPDLDASISIVGPGTAAAVCDVATLDCLAGADAGLAGDDETFDYAVATTGTYYVIVDTYAANQGGSFTLTVSAM